MAKKAAAAASPGEPEKNSLFPPNMALSATDLNEGCITKLDKDFHITTLHELATWYDCDGGISVMQAFGAMATKLIHKTLVSASTGKWNSKSKPFAKSSDKEEKPVEAPKVETAEAPKETKSTASTDGSVLISQAEFEQWKQEREHLETIEEIHGRVKKCQADFEAKAKIAKEAKNKLKAAEDELTEAINDAKQGQKKLPFSKSAPGPESTLRKKDETAPKQETDNDEKAGSWSKWGPDAWKLTPVKSVLKVEGIGMGTIDKVIDAGAATMGDLQDKRAAGWKFSDIAGVGQAASDKMTAAADEWVLANCKAETVPVTKVEDVSAVKEHEPSTIKFVGKSEKVKQEFELEPVALQEDGAVVPLSEVKPIETAPEKKDDGDTDVPAADVADSIEEKVTHEFDPKAPPKFLRIIAELPNNPPHSLITRGGKIGSIWPIKRWEPDGCPLIVLKGDFNVTLDAGEWEPADEPKE